MTPAVAALLTLALTPLAAAAPAARTSLEGRVLDLLTSQPIPKANVLIHAADGRQVPGAITDSEGKFILTALSPGQYRIRAERPGYLPTEYGALAPERAGTLLSLREGQRLLDVNLRLTPFSVLSGRVTGQDGEPLQDAAIYCFHRAWSHGRKTLLPAASGTTDDRGEYRLAGLAPGTYLVAAVYTPVARFVAGSDGQGRRQRDSYAPAFYPNAADPASAAPVVVSPGQDAPGIDFTLQPGPSVRLRGRLSPASAFAAARPSVRLLPRDSGASFFLVRNGIVRDQDGRFEIPNVLPGRYILSAESVSGPVHYLASLPLDVPPTDVDGLDLTLAPAPSVSGLVVSKAATPPDYQRIVLTLQPQASLPAQQKSARLAADGSFSFPDVPPGTYSLSLRGLPKDVWLQSILAGDLEIPEDSLVVQPGAPLTQLRIVLGTGPGRIDGVVTGPQGDRHWATVLLIPDQRRLASRYQRTTTDQYGAFSFPGVAPGSYSLFAWDDLDPGAEFDPEFQALHQKAAYPLTLRSGAAEAVALQLILHGTDP